jgi:L-threonylcarbamoyladenylate synthase
VAQLTVADAAAMQTCVAGGGVVLFPADTVYGLGCDAGDAAAAARLFALKGRAPSKPAAVMFFDLEPALALLAAAGPRTTAAAIALLPGAVTLLIANPRRRFALACGTDAATLGLRVPALPPALAALRGVAAPLLQTSANQAGGPDARLAEQVPQSIRDGVDLILDGGELPGTPSTVIDLRTFEEAGDWRVLRDGALASAEIERVLER